MTGLRIPHWGLHLSRAIAWGFWLGCVGVPLGALFGRSLRTDVMGRIFDPEILAIARSTAGQALLSTSISVLIAISFGLWAGARPRLSDRVLRWLVLPFSVPSVVAGMVGVSMLGRTGWLAKAGIRLDWIFSLKAVVAVHVLLNAPWLCALVARARREVPAREEDAARVLGADWRARLRWVIAPRVLWPLLTGASQVFGFCVMSFAIVLLLGGGPPVETLETAIYQRIRSSLLDIGSATACGLWQLALTLGPWLLVLALAPRQTARVSGIDAPTAGSPIGWLKSGMALGFLVPFAVLLIEARWRGLLAPEVSSVLWPALGVSLTLALAAGLVTLGVALAMVVVVARDGRTSAFLFALPSGISTLVIALGFWLAWARWLDLMEGSWVAMVLVQSTLFIPLVFRSLWPWVISMRRRPIEAALLLGASPFRAYWTVEGPRIRRAVLSVVSIVVASSLGEVAAVSLFYSESLVPLSLLVQRWMGQYRFVEAQALAALLLILAAGTVWVFQRENSAVIEN